MEVTVKLVNAASSWCCLAAVLLLAGCPDATFEDGTDSCDGGKYRCMGNIIQACTGGKYVDKLYCAKPSVCAASLGRCAACFPGSSWCKGDVLHKCTAEGTFGAKIKACNPGWCNSGGCYDPCANAASSKSYMGCKYWPTVTMNSVSDEFSFAVAVANTSTAPAKVTVASATNSSLAKATVAPNSVATIKLPWGKHLKTQYGLIGKAAYRLTSNLPVTVYQFSPLNYVLNHECKIPDSNPKDGKCFSYSNDASLLLPDHALAKEYMVIAQPTHAMIASGQDKPNMSPGFFTVVATEPGITKLSVTFAGDAQGGHDTVAYYSKGQTVNFSLGQFDVNQVLSRLPSSCTPNKTDSDGHKYCKMVGTDLTGTVIKADKKVAVFVGHQCTFLPYDKWACDHLEEQMFPISSWGKKYIGTHTTSSQKDPNIYRLVSATDGNKLTFNPSIISSVTLNRGKFVDFMHAKDFEVRGKGRFAVAQFMVGQGFSHPVGGTGDPGDPAMALAVPVEQYRTDYRFLAPNSFQQNYVNIIAPVTSVVMLDGTRVAASSLRALGSTGYAVAKLKIKGGGHVLESSSGGFGIMVYGVGAYTSYMYAGGLDLKILK